MADITFMFEFMNHLRIEVGPVHTEWFEKYIFCFLLFSSLVIADSSDGDNDDDIGTSDGDDNDTSADDDGDIDSSGGSCKL